MKSTRGFFFYDFKSYVSECGLNHLELESIEKEYWSYGIDPLDERAYDGFEIKNIIPWKSHQENVKNWSQTSGNTE